MDSRRVELSPCPPLLLAFAVATASSAAAAREPAPNCVLDSDCRTGRCIDLICVGGAPRAAEGPSTSVQPRAIAVHEPPEMERGVPQAAKKKWYGAPLFATYGGTLVVGAYALSGPSLARISPRTRPPGSRLHHSGRPAAGARR